MVFVDVSRTTTELGKICTLVFHVKSFGSHFLSRFLAFGLCFFLKRKCPADLLALA